MESPSRQAFTVANLTTLAIITPDKKPFSRGNLTILEPHLPTKGRHAPLRGGRKLILGLEGLAQPHLKDLQSILLKVL